MLALWQERIGLELHPDIQSSPTGVDFEDDEDENVHFEDPPSINLPSGCWLGIIHHPYAFKRGLWDVTSLLLVVYDMIMIPFSFFDPPQTWFTLKICQTKLSWNCW